MDKLFVKNFGTLERALQLCKDTCYLDDETFVDTYLFGTAFYAFMSGYKPDMPIGIIVDFLSFKREEYSYRKN